MKILITGAFGNLGLTCVDQALAQGFEVRCFDLNTSKNRKTAHKYRRQQGSKIEVILGDIQQGSLHHPLVEGVDAIIHNASLLPPATENNPSLAYSINVTASKNLINAAAVNANRPVFVFPSSVTVFGLPKLDEGELDTSAPVVISDIYTQHKIALENYLQQSSLPSVVLRVGVSVDARTLKTDRTTFKNLLNVHADNPLEYVHPKDVALAMCNACKTLAARNKVLLIGGGRSCQVNQRQFLLAAFKAAGLYLPSSIHGDQTFYTHWMDTTESQTILQFQHRSFSDYEQQLQDKLKGIRLLLAPLRWPVNRLLPWILARL